MHRCLSSILRRFFACAVSSSSASSHRHGNRRIPSRLHSAQRSRNDRSRGLRRCAHSRHVAARGRSRGCRESTPRRPTLDAREIRRLPRRALPIQPGQRRLYPHHIPPRRHVIRSRWQPDFQDHRGRDSGARKKQSSAHLPAFAGHGRPFPHRGPLQPRFHRSAVRARSASERHVQLPRQHRRAWPEQHRHRHPAAGFEQRLRHPLEHRLLQLRRQPLSPRSGPGVDGRAAN